MYTIRAAKWGKLAIVITIIGFLAHLGYFITRWMYTGHAPVSNMFEFTTAFGMFLVLCIHYYCTLCTECQH